MASAVSPSAAQDKLQQAFTLHHQGQLAQAETLYTEVLTLEPRNFDALHLLGVIASQSKNYQRAVDLMGQAIAIFPHNAVFHRNHGFALQKLNQWDAAVESYSSAIALQADYADAYSCRGNALSSLGQWETAVESYNKALAIKPDFATYNNRGIALKNLKQLDAATQSFDQAIALKPDFAEAFNNRGNVLQALGQFDAAVESFNKAIAIKPTSVEAYNNRGISLLELKRPNEAVASYNQAIALKPDYASAYNNRGIALQELGQLNAALESYNKAIALQPDYADAYGNCGMLLQQLNQLDAALASYDKAIAIKPNNAEAYWNKSLSLLLDGQFERGWELYEWRWKTARSGLKERRFHQPLWLGVESLQGKTILLHAEQGLGDTIQFCRYAKSVADLGARVILEVPKALMNLLKDLDGVVALVESEGLVGLGSELPAFDFHCPLLSLPLAFKSHLNNLPTAPAYLRSDADKLSHWEHKLGPQKTKRVGLVWSGSTWHKNDRNRSMTLSQLLAHLPNSCAYVSLQKELRDADLATLQAHADIQHFGEDLQDLTDTAALCDLMDVVITVDTSIAHLAGALGKPTWVMLPFAPDWRWLLDRKDSVWYPSVKLHRQNAVGDWSNVFESVRAALA